MLSFRETAYALFGAWRLAHFDIQGAAYFDRSREGALRSFWAAAILLPAYPVLMLVDLAGRPVVVGWPALMLVYAITYVVGWTAYPVAMVWVARALDREEEYFGYLAMYNWSQVLVVLAVLPMMALRAGHLLPEPLVGLLGLAVDLAVASFLWFIARTGLRIGPFAAVGVVALDLVLSDLIRAIGDQLVVGGASGAS
ncbi:MAG: hypothetical protein L0210_13710 [Rhodospirillales bacterium]|nr:hypothetical protein [Rhodospirillales bacterium]